MTPHALLGVRADADEREIKRAYAQRLRTVRPDEDPAGFQQLHAAYKAALAQAQARARHAAALALAAGDGADGADGDEDHPQHAGADAPNDAAPNPPAIPAPPPRMTAPPAPPPGMPGPPPVATPRMPAPPSVPAAPRLPVPRQPSVDADGDGDAVMVAPRVAAAPAFNTDEFFARLSQMVGALDAKSLTAQLQQEPAFWSLAIKAAVRQQLLARIDAQRVPMPAENFDALLAFFDLDHVLAGVDAYAVHRLRRQRHLAWELLPEHAEQLAARLRVRPAVIGSDSDLRSLLHAAQTPPGWRAIVPHLLTLRFPARFTDFIQRLALGQPRDLPPPFDPRAIRFWTEAAQMQTPTWRTLAFSGLQTLAWLLLVFVLVGVAVAYAANSSSTVALLYPAGVAVWRVLMFSLLAGRAALNWLLRPTSKTDAAWVYWLRLGMLPALALIGTGLSAALDPIFGCVPLLVALCVLYSALLRVRGKRDLLSMLQLYLLLCTFAMLFAGWQGALAAAGLVCLGWGGVVWRLALHRRR